MAKAKLTGPEHICEIGTPLKRCPSGIVVEALADRDRALTQARAELEAEKDKTAVYRHVPDDQMGDCNCYYCTVKMLELSEAQVADLQAKLAAAESKLKDKLEGVGTICLIHNSEACAECVTDLRKAESQAAELRKIVIVVPDLRELIHGRPDGSATGAAFCAKGGSQGQCAICALADQAIEALASLPASVQARAEREQAVKEKGAANG